MRCDYSCSTDPPAATLLGLDCTDFVQRSNCQPQVHRTVFTRRVGMPVRGGEAGSWSCVFVLLAE